MNTYMALSKTNSDVTETNTQFVICRSNKPGLALTLCLGEL
jgi:hypothetical protein